MTKKSTSAKKKHTVTPAVSQAERQLALIQYHFLEEHNYTEAVRECESLLSYLPQRSSQRVDVLTFLGNAHGMLQNHPESYRAFNEALALEPQSYDLWFNRGQASLFTSRIGQAHKDFLRARELDTKGELKKELEESLKLTEKGVADALKMRGPEFTLDQLIEQEEHFQHGMDLMEAGEWEDAEVHFRATIAMGDCLPQPWGNLGTCLMMQERYDEAEAALQRALVIDPKYAPAQQNLRLLPETRRNGLPTIFEVQDPFRNSKRQPSVRLLKES